jgi:hypothetical protein
MFILVVMMYNGLWMLVHLDEGHNYYSFFMFECLLS